MNPFSRSTLPWILAALFAAAFAVLAFSRREFAMPGSVSAPTPASRAATPTREKKVLYWTDPMTPGFRSDKPGKSPFMDMDLVPVYKETATGGPGAPGSSGASGAPGAPLVGGYSTITLAQPRQQAIGRFGTAQGQLRHYKVRVPGDHRQGLEAHAQGPAAALHLQPGASGDATGVPSRAASAPAVSVVSKSGRRSRRRGPL